jgi:hypothetical protein
VDRVQQHGYLLSFENRFLKAKADAFQRLFEELMARVYPGDFEACRPYGPQGDRKNDGYLPSQRTLFQVYAPYELKSHETVKKVREDFSGALEHWRDHFDRWVFVHNAFDGRLPPEVIAALAEIRLAHPGIALETWGYPELAAEFRKLGLDVLEPWLGVMPTMEDKSRLGFAEIKAVVEHIKLAPVEPSGTPRPVPSGKIEFNLLSGSVAAYLKIGMEKAPLVEDYFTRCRDPLYGVQVANAFKDQYKALRDRRPHLHPTELWGELEDWAGGNQTRNPTEKLAITAVLAWLFDHCDIFEEPPSPET